MVIRRVGAGSHSEAAHRGVVQADEAYVRAQLEGPIEPRARETAGEHVEVSRCVVVSLRVKAERHSERQRIEHQHCREEDADGDEECTPRLLQLA